MDSEVDWGSLLGLIEELSSTIVKYYAENEVEDREVGLQAMVVLAHLTRSSISELDQDFEMFVKQCMQISLEVQNARAAAKTESGMKN